MSFELPERGGMRQFRWKFKDLWVITPINGSEAERTELC